MPKTKKTSNPKKAVLYDKTSAGCDLNRISDSDQKIVTSYIGSSQTNIRQTDEDRVKKALTKIQNKKPLNKTEHKVLGSIVDHLSTRYNLDCAKKR